jgi:hypothetical protein
MEKAIHMDLATKLGTGHLILLIHHIAHLSGVVVPRRGDQQGQISPVIHWEILCASRHGVPLGGGPFLPSSLRKMQQGAELFSA